MTTGDRIKAKRLELGISIEDLADKLNKNRATIYRYESNDIENFPTTVLEPLAKVLQTTPAYLMGWEDTKPTNQSKKGFDVFSIPGIMPLPKTYKLPLFGSIACGTPVFAEQNIEDYIDTPESVRADFCLRCKGDSMVNARILDGDIVFIREQPMVDDGEIAAVLIDDETTLKRGYYDKTKNKLMLVAENTTFPPLVYVNEELNEIKILGKAVYFASVIK